MNAKVFYIFSLYILYIYSFTFRIYSIIFLFIIALVALF